MVREKFGILGRADIAYSRFSLALMMHNEPMYVGIATRCSHKTQRFVNTYGSMFWRI